MSEDPRSAIRLLAKGGGIIFAGRVLDVGISFVAKVIIAQWLGPFKYGAVAIGVTTLVLLSSVVVLGLHRGVGRYLPRNDSESWRRGVVRSAFQLAVPLSVLAASALFLSADVVAVRFFDDPAVGPVLKVAALAVPFAVVYHLSIGSIQGVKRSVPKVVVEDVTLPVSRLVVVLVAVGLGFGAVGVMAAYSFAFVAAGLLGIYYVTRYTPIFTSGPAERMHRELLSFSAPLIVVGLMGKLLADVDTYLLGHLATLTDVGIYNVVYPVALLLMAVQMSFGFILMPVLSEHHAEEEVEEEAIRRLYHVVTKWIVFVTLPLFLGMAFYPEFLIRLTFGSEYVEGGIALTILVLGFFFNVAIGPNGKLLNVYGATTALMWIQIATVALNVALNVLLIPRYTFVGAAVATAVSYVAMNLAYSALVYRLAGIVPFSRRMVRPGAASIAVFVVIYAAVTRLFPVTLVPVVGVFVLFTVCYAVLVLRLGGIEREEIQLVEDLEHKFDVDLEPVKAVARRIAK